MCKQDYPWKVTVQSPTAFTPEEFDVGWNAAIEFAANMWRQHEPAPVPVNPCANKKCNLEAVTGSLCHYHYNDTHCNKIITRGINKVQCGQKANKNKFCKHHQAL